MDWHKIHSAPTVVVDVVTDDVDAVVVVDVVEPDPQNSQVNWQCLATQFLLHLPLFFLL